MKFIFITKVRYIDDLHVGSGTMLAGIAYYTPYKKFIDVDIYELF